MSDVNRFSLASKKDSISYRVEHNQGVTFIFGEIPVNDFAKLAKGNKKAVIDPSLARLADAQIAFGSEEDIKAMKIALIPIAIKRYREKAANLGYSDAEINWLGGGDVGLSSATIFRKLRGIPAFDQTASASDNHPRDVSDLGRCVALLDAVPGLRERMVEMAEVSPEWKGLAEDWAELEAEFKAEVAEHAGQEKFSMKKTAALLTASLTKYKHTPPRP